MDCRYRVVLSVHKYGFGVWFNVTNNVPYSNSVYHYEKGDGIMDIKEQLSSVFESLSKQKPLIHHITNYVTVNDCANAVLAIGGSPIMADDTSDIEAIVKMSDALVLNIGTVNHRTLDSMLKAAKIANEHGIPVVLDPVGVGVTPFRHEAVTKLLRSAHISVIRGNFAEIRNIAGLESKSAGVDSLDEEHDGAKLASTLAKSLGCTIAITGKEDIISNGQSTYILSNGDSLLTKVTGTGCMSTSLIASFLGASRLALVSAVAGISVMAIAGELADKSKGTGTFRTSLMDVISQMDYACLQTHINVQKV